MPMIGARFYTQLDAAQMRNDVIEEDLAKVNHLVIPTFLQEDIQSVFLQLYLKKECFLLFFPFVCLAT